MKEITINPGPGSNIGTVCDTACEQAAEQKCMVSFKFNDIEIVALPDSKPEFLRDLYMHTTDVRHERHIESAEYKARQEKYRKAAEERTAKRAEAMKEAPTNMQLKDPDGWEEWKDINQGGYGGAVTTYAERWACLMEMKMSQGAELKDIVQECSNLADVEGVTGFMYGYAVNVLSQVWKHGEELRVWHNKDSQLGDEGDKANESGGVLNPAVLNIGVK